MRNSTSCTVVLVLIAGVLAGMAGCQQPERPLVTFPQGTLTVHFEEASAPSSCLVASVAMAANYALGERQYTEPGLRAALRQRNLDETSIANLKTLMTSEGLEMVVLAGRPDGEPPLGLRYWVQSRGYPAICVINQHSSDPKLNHAVVVTGFSANTADPPADIVYYLDPAARDPLQSVGLSEFENSWARCDYAMIIVVKPAARK